MYIAYKLFTPVPMPSQALVTLNDTNRETMMDFSADLDRHIQYINKLPAIKESDIAVTLITSCLENDCVNRPTAEKVCKQLARDSSGQQKMYVTRQPVRDRSDATRSSTESGTNGRIS